MILKRYTICQYTNKVTSPPTHKIVKVKHLLRVCDRSSLLLIVKESSVLTRMKTLDDFCLSSKHCSNPYHLEWEQYTDSPGLGTDMQRYSPVVGIILAVIENMFDSTYFGK